MFKQRDYHRKKKMEVCGDWGSANNDKCLFTQLSALNYKNCNLFENLVCVHKSRTLRKHSVTK